MAAIRKGVKLVLGGLFNIEVNVLGAVDDDTKETAFHTVCAGAAEDSAHAPARVRQSLICPDCANDVKDTFRKAREVGKGTYALVDSAELEAAAVDEALKLQMQLTVHDAADVDATALPGEKVYYLEPGKGPLVAKSYNLLRDKIAANPDKVICTIWAGRSKPGMFRLGVFGDALTLEQLAWPENVRQAPAVPEMDYTEQESAMIGQLLESIEAPFDATTYRDERKDQITAIIAAAEAVEGSATDAAPRAAKTAAPTLDLTASLQAALGAATAAKPAKAKKAAAKKAPARKSA